MIDTQNKRRSVVKILPVPDSIISIFDRAQIIGLYSGIFGGIYNESIILSGISFSNVYGYFDASPILTLSSASAFTNTNLADFLNGISLTDSSNLVSIGRSEFLNGISLADSSNLVSIGRSEFLNGISLTDSSNLVSIGGSEFLNGISLASVGDFSISVLKELFENLYFLNTSDFQYNQQINAMVDLILLSSITQLQSSITETNPTLPLTVAALQNQTGLLDILVLTAFSILVGLVGSNSITSSIAEQIFSTFIKKLGFTTNIKKLTFTAED